MIFKAVLSNKAHPEYGQAAIPFPISGSDYDYTLELLERLPPKIFDILERPDDAISELNRLCQAIRGLDDAGLKKLEAVVLMAQPEEAGEIRQLAENLDQFAFIPGVELSENCQVNELGYVAYHGGLTLEELMREDPAEQYQREQEMGGMSPSAPLSGGRG